MSERPPDFPAAGCALVIGGSGGIGRAICEGLAAAGAKVALTYRSNRAAADELAAALGGHSIAADLSDPSSVKTCVAEAAESMGGVHSLVYAAGASISQDYVGQVSAAEWEQVMGSDASGFFHLVQAALPHLRERGGSITAISSSGLDRFPPRDILSVAPKATIEALIKAVAREEGRNNVRANSVRVAVADAGMFLRLKEELGDAWIEAAKKNTPLRRFAEAREIADAVVFLASSRASYITGQALAVDGGYAT
jgi:NAD(P)-dependent dehydrogenase (short-subunit alcohol dehydrogenase family)